MAILLLSSILLLLLAGAGALAGSGKDECKPARCNNYGPLVRFPFRLKDHHPDHCAYSPAFHLYCTQNRSDPVIDLLFPVNASPSNTRIPFTIQASVKKIDYKSQTIISISYLQSCLPPHPSVPNNATASMFRILRPRYYPAGSTLFNCSSDKAQMLSYPITCLGGAGYQVYAVNGDLKVSDLSLTACSSMYSISYAPLRVLLQDRYSFKVEFGWSEPVACRACEVRAKYCRWKDKSSPGHGTECFRKPTGSGESTKLVVGVVVPGVFLIVLIGMALYRVVMSKKRKKDDQAKIERFLEDYEAHKPARFSYADIKRFTNQFRDQLGQGSYGTVFKGKLSDDILIAVKVLNNDSKGGEEFINEVGIIGTIHHVNVVRLVGYCADGFRRALVYEFLPNNSLEKFVYSKSHKNNFLGWEKMEHIALGTAKGIEYLHQGCAQQILHFDIKPHNILLDQNFNPKISDFGLAKLCSKEKSIVSMTAARGTMGYIAPEVFSRNFGNVSSKSDVYSFGMLLLEMVGARENIDTGIQNTTQPYFPQWIYDRLGQGREVGIQIEGEGSDKIAKKLTTVGLWCIRWHPVDRPSMKTVIQMLEGQEIPSMPPNPFGPTNAMTASADRPGRTFSSKLEVISERE
ncbi:hypothetical protein RJ640_006462 [Escallonia rubra]|uniref:Protein kinase domain-containing protein n=1 Tax=Escallonia rubra TaxID=112253 RepID=A0AA88RIK8_9ASTE|nr:hypothetical protein RJ640_006462 [Escallonia rubra]